MSYINGNYVVFPLPGGGRQKRALRSNENLNPNFPDSIDLKITNSCSQGCPFCHENSIPGGKSFSLSRTRSVLSTLPKAPIEIAIGGGNIFDCSKDTYELIKWMKDYGFNPRITISYEEFKKREDVFYQPSWTKSKNHEESLIKEVSHIGVSINRHITLTNYLSKSIVWHVIIGVMPIEEMIKVLQDSNFKKILILGFKQFGRAKDQEISNLEDWKLLIKNLIQENNDSIPKTIGFDNLALEQLEVKKYLSEEDWNSLWFGPEFSSSMYIDAVEETFAPTSRSIKRTSWNSISLLDYFNLNKNVFSD